MRRLKFSLLRRLAAATFCIAATSASPTAMASDIPVVAAASSLQFAMPEIIAAFAAQTGRTVKVAYGSSGNFVRQIRQGAPFELFLSADAAYIRALVDDDLTLGAGNLYALGRLAIIVSPGSSLTPDGTLEDLRAALADGRVRRFAIANPEHAPYGRRAEEALRHVGLWEGIRDRLILGENVSQAAQFATSGSAEGGIIAYSLALSQTVSDRGEYALIPPEWHAPLEQRMALLKGAGDTARAFHDFVLSEPGRGILKRLGFLLPDEGA